jgi:branched-chain amino acid transport system substrate-binding protein
MKRRSFLLGTAAALGAASPARAAFAQELIIGVNVPLSGDMRAQGEQILNGVRGAVEEQNRLSGALDRAWGVRTFDDMGALATSITNVQFAASDPSIVATIGSLTSSTIIGSLPSYAGAQMPLIVPASTADAITARGYRNVWRLPTKDSAEGSLFARTLIDAHKPARPLAVLQDGDYGYDVAQGFVAQMKARGVSTADAYVFPYDKPDYALAAKTILTKQPDYIFLAGRTHDMGPLIPALRKAGYTGPLGGSEGLYNAETTDKYAKLLGDSALISTSTPPVDRAPSQLQTLADLRAAYGTVTPLMAFGYASAQIVIAASRRIGSPNRLSVMSSLQTGGSYSTMVGNFTFTPTGDPLDPNVYFYSIVDGALKYQRPAHVTSFVL